MRKHAFIETLITYRVFARYTVLVLKNQIQTRIDRKRLDPFTAAKHAFYRSIPIQDSYDEFRLQLAVMSAYTKMLQRTA